MSIQTKTLSITGWQTLNRMKVKFGPILLLLLVNSISGIAQQDNPDLYDIGGEFAFVRVQYDSYYDGGFYGGFYGKFYGGF